MYDKLPDYDAQGNMHKESLCKELSQQTSRDSQQVTGCKETLGVQFLYTAVFKIKLFYFIYLYFSWPTQDLVCAYMYVEMSHVQNVNTC